MEKPASCVHQEKQTLGVLSRMLHVRWSGAICGAFLRLLFPSFRRPRFGSVEERNKILEYAGPYWHAPIYFALMTGCRQGEIWARHREQLDRNNAVVRIDRAVYRGKVGLPKHDKVRTIEMSPALVSFMRWHLKIVPLKSSLVFPTDEGGIRPERKVNTGLRRMCKRAGIQSFSWYVLRHTFASHLVMRGIPVQVVQQLLGHPRIEETMRYAHLSPHMRRGAVALLDALGDLAASRPGYF